MLSSALAEEARSTVNAPAKRDAIEFRKRERSCQIVDVKDRRILVVGEQPVDC